MQKSFCKQVIILSQSISWHSWHNYKGNQLVWLKHVGREGGCAPDNGQTAAETPRAAAGGAREEEREHDQHRRQEEAAQHAGPGHTRCLLSMSTILHLPHTFLLDHLCGSEQKHCWGPGIQGSENLWATKQRFVSPMSKERKIHFFRCG